MVDAAWNAFMSNSNEIIKIKDERNIPKTIPKCSELYISTKTIITYLNKPIDLKQIFPKIKILPYYQRKEGIIKKSMKYNFESREEVIETLKLFEKANFYTEYVLKKQMQSPFKDIRKISVGLSNKDIISYRKKKKGAFYNCFVIIMRIKIDNENYKECHVKIFNTGKIEIPGIKHNTLLKKVLNNILILLNDLNIVDIDFKDTIETVLINSNFNCGYSINRDKLAQILKQKYSLNVSYDPCSYPGIMCKFYYDKFDSKTNGIENKNKKSCFLISFMIFRTGSILVVGKATEKVLYYIYNFIKNILNNEFSEIYNNSVIQEKTVVRKKIRKKQIIISA